jgi:hypothetical protein
MDFNTIQFFAHYLPPWGPYAACAGKDTADWYPEDDRPASDATVRYARSLCSVCSVRRECLRWSAENVHSLEHGIYAGTTGEERKLAMKQGPGWMERLLEGENEEAMA